MTQREILKHIQDDLYAKWRNTGHILRGYKPEGAMLTPDSIKFSKPYRAAKAAYDKAFSDLRKFNSQYGDYLN